MHDFDGHPAAPDRDALWAPLPGSLLCCRRHAERPASTATLISDLASTRQRHFLAGRDCADAALSALGASTTDVLRGADGAPIWPPGLVGSIAHDGLRAAAIVSWSTQWQSLGVDVEPAQPLPEDAAAVALIGRERACLAALDAEDPLRYGRLPFAAKECVHKAINPLTGDWLEFDEVCIEFGDARLDQGEWYPRLLTAAAREAFDGLTCTGRWWRDEGGWLVVLGLR